MLERNRHKRCIIILNACEIGTRCDFKTRIIERKTRSLYISHNVDDSNKSLFGYICLGRNMVEIDSIKTEINVMLSSQLE